MKLLPTIHSENDYRRVYEKHEVWLPAVQAICRRHGLCATDLRRQVLGTHVVFRTGDLIVKLFSQCWPNDFLAEKSCLEDLRGLPIPRLVEIGEFESWPYMILTVVDGYPAVDVWPSLGLNERATVVRQLGQFMQDLHGQPLISGLPVDWNTYLADRIAGLDEHHRLEEPWREWVNRKLAGLEQHPHELRTLNCDLTYDHILLKKREDQWRLSGIIDFGDAMIAPNLFEFSVPLLCFCAGEPVLSRTLVESYGQELTVELAEDIVAYSLLHAFISLPEILDIMEATAPDFLMEAIWGSLM